MATQVQKKHLQRKLGLFAVTNIVIANIIGAGIFTTTGYLMEYLKHPVIMLSLWIIGGIIAFFGALSFGELGAAIPKAGGDYVFISKIFHPLPGFLSGWLSLIVGFSAPIAASAIGFSKYFLWAFPEILSGGIFGNSIDNELISKILAVAIIVLFSAIHARGIVLGAILQNGLTVLKVLLVLGLIVVGFLFGKGNMGNIGSAPAFDFNFQGWKSIGLSLMFVMFAYSGWNSATYIGSEIKNPVKTIPRSLLISTLVVIVLYFFLNLFFVYAVPPSKMIGEPEIAGVAAGAVFGQLAEKVVSLLVSFALFSSLSAFIILGPRVYYQMANDGYFFKSIAKIHNKYKVPVNAILLQSAIAIVLVLSGTFEQILVYMGFSLGIFPIVAVLGVFKLRKQNKSILKMPGYPWVQLIFVVCNLAILVLAFFERPLESSVAIITALSGIPVFYWFNFRKNKRNN